LGAESLGPGLRQQPVNRGAPPCPKQEEVRKMGSEKYLVLIFDPIFLTFLLKKRHFRNLCKFLAIKPQDGPNTPLKNVLTAKKGHFLGVLEEKRGVCDLNKPFYFEFFEFFGIFWIASR
jgi:hypothetical protein